MKRYILSLSALLVLVLVHGEKANSFPLCRGKLEVQSVPDRGWHNCIGSVIASDGNRYVGQFRSGKPDGEGIFYFSSGDKYVGDYVDGKRHGKGIFSFSNGDQYIGDYRNGKRHGSGVFYFGRTGNKFFGHYIDGKRHGSGTLLFANGIIQQGMWHAGKLKVIKKNSNLEGNNNLPSLEKTRLDKSKLQQKLFKISSGTGFAVTRLGHIITSGHNIKECSEIRVSHKNNTFNAHIVSKNFKNDLAVLKVDFKSDNFLRFSRNPAKLIEEVYVAGYPFGQKVSRSVKITRGIVSSLIGLRDDFSRIQVDAATQPGNSGGPIVNDRGNVIGVVTGKLGHKAILAKYGTIPENISFGVKSDVVIDLLNIAEVKIEKANTNPAKKADLGAKILGATYYLSCWATMEKIGKPWQDEPALRTSSSD